MKNTWQTRKLGDIFEIQRGGSPRPIGSFLTEAANGINWIKIGDTKNISKYIYKTAEKIRPEGLKKSRLVKEGDFLLSNSMSFGRPYIMKTTGAIHDGWLVLREKLEKVDKDFFYYLLGSPLVFRQFDILAAGSTVRNLNTKLVASVGVPFPSLEEQKRIVKILDNFFEKIETVKKNTGKSLQDSQDIFVSYMTNIFSNPSKDWGEKRFDEVCILQRGFDLPTQLRKEGDHPLVSSNGITDKVSIYKVKAPGVVTGRSGTIGKVHYIEEDFWPLNTSLYIKDFYNNNERFIYYFLKQFDLSKYSSGAGVPTLNRNSVHCIKVYLPTSLNEQKQIVTNLDTLFDEIKKLKNVYKQKLILLEELRKSVLHEAFSGEL